MFQSLGGWINQHQSRVSNPLLSQRYASSSRPPPSRGIPNRPPLPEKPKVDPKSTTELPNSNDPIPQRQKLRFREKLMPQFIRSRPALRGWLFGFTLTLPIAALALPHLPFTWYTVTGPSMRPTLNPDCENNNDTLYKPMQVIVQRWSLNTRAEIVRRANTKDEIYTGKYKRGDIVIYWTPHDPSRIGVKRIVALPGDSVTPMNGYNGEDNPEEVIVPFNHLWIEGDVNDRRKSVDSNYFGPISQSLVKGRVTALWSPWWNIFSMRKVDSAGKGWPARNEGRVKEGAVHEATVNPDALSKKQSFEQGQQSEAMLKYLKEQPTRFVERWEEESDKGNQFRVMIRQLSATAADVAQGHEDQQVREVARDLVSELHRLIGTKALANAATKAQAEKTKTRWTPTKTEDEQKELVSKSGLFTDLNVPEDERAREREAKTSPASVALRKMLEQKAQIASAVDKEYEELEKAKLQRSGFAE